VSSTTPNLVEVADGVFRVSSQLGVRRIAQWLVTGDDGILLIDTGVAGTISDQIIPALDSLGRDVSDITDAVISHADVDHYGGNGELRQLAPDVRIVASGQDRPLIESWERVYRDRYSWYEQHDLAYDSDTLDWLRGAGGPDTALDGVISEGDILRKGSTVIRVLELPGHSAGHLGFVVQGTGCAIIVDAVLERGLYDIDDRRISPPPYVTSKGYRDSIERLKELNLDRLETAHYRDITGSDVSDFLDASSRFTNDLERIVRHELADGPRSIAEITQVADRELGPFSAMGLELARSIGAHLEDLRDDGDARVEAEGQWPVWTAS